MERRFIKSGIPGLDKVLGGGLLEGSITTVSGPTGSGKSTLALQFLYNGGMESNEPGLYICIEESRQDFLFHTSGYRWDFQKAERDHKFIILDYPIHEVDQVLNQYSAIAEIINSIGVKRVVIDSIMPIALFFKENDERKKGFLKLIENIRKWGVTTMIVSEDMQGTTLGVLPSSAYGIETFTDGWINFTNNYDPVKGERFRMIEVLKMKGVSHSSKPYPAVIDAEGVTVLSEDRPVAAPREAPRPAMIMKSETPPKTQISAPAAQRLAFLDRSGGTGGGAGRIPPAKTQSSAPAAKPAAPSSKKEPAKTAVASETPASIAKRLAAVKKKLLKMKKKG